MNILKNQLKLLNQSKILKCIVIIIGCGFIVMQRQHKCLFGTISLPGFMAISPILLFSFLGAIVLIKKYPKLLFGLYLCCLFAAEFYWLNSLIWR